ncbi:MAG: hypothetical protein CL912_33160 [Deltaproteobacteria bacterium]|nr:hypothetical protein [Deltaproteobacteria bacterium]
MYGAYHFARRVLPLFNSVSDHFLCCISRIRNGFNALPKLDFEAVATRTRAFVCNVIDIQHAGPRQWEWRHVLPILDQYEREDHLDWLWCRKLLWRLDTEGFLSRIVRCGMSDVEYYGGLARPG